MLDSRAYKNSNRLCLCDQMKGVINILGKSQIYEIIDFMKVLYPHTKKLIKNNTTVEVWIEILGDNTTEDIKKAIISFSKKEDYPPTPQAILKELESQFKVEMKKTNAGTYIIWVRYCDELIQFKYQNKAEAEELFNYLRTYPPREDVRKLSEELIIQQTRYYRGETYYNPEILEEMEEHRRKTWMNMKINEYQNQSQRRDKK